MIPALQNTTPPHGFACESGRSLVGTVLRRLLLLGTLALGSTMAQEAGPNSAGEAGQLVLSYHKSSRNFEWNRINSSNRESVIALLKEIQTGKRSTVAGVYTVIPSVAEQMLIGIGDDETIREIVARYHRREPGPTNITDIVEIGQAMAIPYLADDLVSDKYLYFEEMDVDGKVYQVIDGDKAYRTARNIALISMNSRQFPEAVRASAKTLEKQIKYKNKGIAVSRMADWWRLNEQWFAAQQLSKVSPFPTLEPATTVTAPAAR